MKSTKSLARHLGIIKKHPRHAEHSKTTPRVTPQAFSYLVVIDFEATCWKNGEGPAGAQSEVIEFPAVLLNTATGEIEAEFHRYVQPQEHPYLSNFCTELTGITQDQVDHGIPLHICLAQFGRWLTSVQTEKSAHFVTGKTIGKNTTNKWGTFVTWSDWDLGVCLQYECRRKGISKPSALNCWLDLRATYKKFYGRKPNGLKGALRDLGIEFEGREHSGIEDARNTAKLAWRMMGDGCVMQITKSLIGPIPQLKVTNQIKSPQAIQDLGTTSKSVNNSPSVQLTNLKSTPASMLQEEGAVVKPTDVMNLPKQTRHPLSNSTSIHDASSTFSDSVRSTSSKDYSIGNQNLPSQSTSSMKKACATGSKYTAHKGKTTNMSGPRGKVYAQQLSSTRQGLQIYASPATGQVQASTTKSTTLLANLGKDNARH